MQIMTVIGQGSLLAISMIYLMEILPVNLVIRMYAGREGIVIFWSMIFIIGLTLAGLNFGRHDE